MRSDSIDYRAFGDPTSAWDSFGFTGGIHDPTGHIHLRARNLDPSGMSFVDTVNLNRMPLITAEQLRKLGYIVKWSLVAGTVALGGVTVVDNMPCQLRGDCDVDDEVDDPPRPGPVCPRVGSEPDSDQRTRTCDTTGPQAGFLTAFYRSCGISHGDEFLVAPNFAIPVTTFTCEGR